MGRSVLQGSNSSLRIGVDEHGRRCSSICHLFAHTEVKTQGQIEKHMFISKLIEGMH